MSTIYKLLDFKWWGIGSTLYLSDSYNNISGFDDSSQVVGGVSGIIRYSILNTSASTPKIEYYCLIYFRQSPTSNNPPRSLSIRNDSGRVITAYTGYNCQIFHNGTTYWVYQSSHVYYTPSTGKWEITSDNVDSDAVFVNEGTSKKNTVHDLGDKTGSTDQQIYLEGLTYLLNEPRIGQGTVTLSVKKPGQILNFTSRLLGSTASQYIDSDATINIQPVAISVLKEGGSYTFNYRPNGDVAYTFVNTQLQSLVKLYINKIHSTVSSNFDTYLNQGSRAFSQSFGEDAYMTNCLPRKTTEEMATLQIWDSRNSGTVDINSTIILFSDAECTRITKNRIYTGTTPTLVSSVQLPAGKYALFGSTEAPRIDVSGTEIRDSNNNIICKRCSKSYPPNTPSYVQAVGLVELAEDMTISLYAYGSSAYNDEQNDIFALKINSAGTIITKNFSGTSSTSYANIDTLTLSAGKYLVVSEITFGTTDIAYAQKVTIGSDIIIYDTGLGGNPAPISSSMSYVDLLKSKTLTLSVKTSSNSVSISGYIKAMRIA